MELRQLEHFVAVAEEGHFTRAASRCHISQSALSTSIRSLQVGGIETPGMLDQAALLASFRDLHPAVDIRYMRDTSMALVPEVAASRLDVAFVSLPRQLPEPVLAIPLMIQPILFVCRPDHPLAGRKRVTLRSLAEQDFVGPLPGWTGYESIDRVFAGTGKRH